MTETPQFPDAYAAETLKRVELRASDDEVKRELEVVCTECEEHLCDADPGDSIDTLAWMAYDHAQRCTPKPDNEEAS